MNAVSLYVTASRLIFSSLNLDDSGKWSDINRLIVFLRQSLTCCVCGNLLVVPMTSAVSSCQHHVCKSCMGGKMRLKPSCSSCKDQSKFMENTQLRILLQNYKKLCRYVNSTEIPNKWGDMPVSCSNGSTPSAVTASASHGVGALISGPTTFYQLIEEGSNLKDKFSFSASNGTQNSGSTVTNTHAHTNKAKVSAVIAAAAAKSKAAAQRQLQRQQNVVPNVPNVPTVPNGTRPTQPAPVVAKQPAPTPAPAPSQPAVAVDPPAAKKIKTESKPAPAVAVISQPQETKTKQLDSSKICVAVKEVHKVVQKTLPPVVAEPVPPVPVVCPQITPQIVITPVSETPPELPIPLITEDKAAEVKLIVTPNEPAVIPASVAAATAAIVATPIADVMNAGLPATPLSASGNGAKKPNKRRGCRCGLATPNPGKLTCCGQRCPCYVDGKGCFDCKCRGCRNPHKANTNSGISVTPAVKPRPATNAPVAEPTPVPTVPSTVISVSESPCSLSSSLSTNLSSSTLSANAALVNTLQSNGVSCQLVTVSQTPLTQTGTSVCHQQQFTPKSHPMIPKTTTITLAPNTLANNNLFLSPGICLINTPAVAVSSSSSMSSGSTGATAKVIAARICQTAGDSSDQSFPASGSDLNKISYSFASIDKLRTEKQ